MLTPRSNGPASSPSSFSRVSLFRSVLEYAWSDVVRILFDRYGISYIIHFFDSLCIWYKYIISSGNSLRACICAVYSRNQIIWHLHCIMLIITFKYDSSFSLNTIVFQNCIKVWQVFCCIIREKSSPFRIFKINQ